MKLVEPGPQPPPFEVEYSELESDRPQAELQDEEDSSNAEGSVEAVEESQAETVSSERHATDRSQPAEQPADEESFGAGLDVGDDVSNPEEKEQPEAGDASKSQSGESAKSQEGTESGQKKRGRRSNRRRRSRRQKKKDGAPPKSES